MRFAKYLLWMSLALVPCHAVATESEMKFSNVDFRLVQGHIIGPTLDFSDSELNHLNQLSDTQKPKFIAKLIADKLILKKDFFKEPEDAWRSQLEKDLISKWCTNCAHPRLKIILGESGFVWQSLTIDMVTTGSKMSDMRQKTRDNFMSWKNIIERLQKSASQPACRSHTSTYQ